MSAALLMCQIVKLVATHGFERYAAVAGVRCRACPLNRGAGQLTSGPAICRGPAEQNVNHAAAAGPHKCVPAIFERFREVTRAFPSQTKPPSPPPCSNLLLLRHQVPFMCPSPGRSRQRRFAWFRGHCGCVHRQCCARSPQFPGETMLFCTYTFTTGPDWTVIHVRALGCGWFAWAACPTSRLVLPRRAWTPASPKFAKQTLPHPPLCGTSPLM